LSFLQTKRLEKTAEKNSPSFAALDYNRSFKLDPFDLICDFFLRSVEEIQCKEKMKFCLVKVELFFDRLVVWERCWDEPVHSLLGV